MHFADAGDAAGIDFVHYNGFSGSYYYVETFGAGAAFLDYNGDGRLDLYLANGTYLTGHPPDQPPVNRLYRNDQGTFADVTAHSGSADPGYGFGVATADYDADGDTDLFVANYGPNALYRNDQGTFAKTSAGPSRSALGLQCRLPRLRSRRRSRPIRRQLRALRPRR